MKVLITGITGMVGSHFADAVRDRGWETWGLARFSASSRRAAIDDPLVIRCDITDRQHLGEVFRKIKPGLVIHMAAQAFNGLSWAMENYTHEANCRGTLNVLQCCKEHVPNSKVLIACSSAEYGDVTEADCPLKEDRLLKPITPYGITKVATECLGYQYFQNHGLQVYLPRMFIHVGTGHPPATAIQNFARQLALIDRGKLEPVIKVGNLDSSRDFIDVRDGVAAMMTLLDKGQPGLPFNIATGTAHSIRDMLNMLVKGSGLKVDLQIDSALLRPSDEPLLLADISRIESLGWKQCYTFQQTLDSVYADWIQRAAML